MALSVQMKNSRGTGDAPLFLLLGQGRARPSSRIPRQPPPTWLLGSGSDTASLPRSPRKVISLSPDADSVFPTLRTHT